MSTGSPQPYVPSELRHTVFDAFHSLSHPGIRATQHLMTARYVWPKINSDIRKWAQSCVKCQKSKKSAEAHGDTSWYICYTRCQI